MNLKLAKGNNTQRTNMNFMGIQRVPTTINTIPLTIYQMNLILRKTMNPKKPIQCQKDSNG